jgi:type III secretory pathway component EscU
MESSLRAIVGIVVLIAGAVVGLVYLYESGRIRPRWLKYLRIIYFLAACFVVLYILYKSPTKHLYVLILAMVIAFIVERAINRFRKLTRFGSRLIVLIVGYSILSAIIPTADLIVFGSTYFVFSVWNYYSDDDVKDQKSD